MQPVPIALCITDLDLGGAERQLAELAARVDPDRFRPVVYCLGPRPLRDEASCVPRIEQAGIEYHCLGGRGARDAPKVVAKLTALLQSQQPAVLQSFLFHANLVGRFAARRAGVPHVVCGLRVSEGRRRWRLWLDRVTQAKVDRYACVSRAVADFALRTARLPAEKLAVIPNGIDLVRYPSTPPADLTRFGIPASAQVVVCVGRLNRQKGQAWLLRSVPQWLGPLPDCHLLLVGDGPDRARLERIGGETGFARRIHFAGFQADVPGILAACTLLVLPSLWEGMPNVVLEAMASRQPVVATDVEGVAELLGPSAGEQTIACGDAPALTARIESILRDEPLARSLGARNRARVEECFSIETTCRAYERLWDSLLAG